MKRNGGFVALGLLLCASGLARGDAAFEQWRQADHAEQSEVLALARQAFDAYIQQRTIIAPPAHLSPHLRQRAAVFVSAMRNGAPRCCMGTLYPTQPTAALEIIENAVAAAGRDRRFAPIKVGEAHGLTLIVSFINRPTPLLPNELSRLDPTRDGLAVKCGDRYGVVLSGETGQTERMLAWGRTRAGARPSMRVELFRIQDVRFVEPPSAAGTK